MLSLFMRGPRRAAFVLLTGSLPALCGASDEVPGSTAGQFAVQGGAASYSIPLSVPPGLGEMKPELSLVYNSNGGDGPIGQGWSLSGLSAITLCPQTLAQDGQSLAVSKSMAKSDQRFCLDGQRLLPTSSSYGSATLVMRPEIDNFSKVSVNGWTGDVPTSFIVKTKAGQELRYGETGSARSHEATSGSSPAVAWYVNDVRDAAQNLIHFEYERSTAGSGGESPETLIKRIRYGHNSRAATDHHALVQFDYEPRTSPDYYSGAGYRFARTQRLKTITTSVNGTNVRSYRLGYGTLARTGADVVTSIQECAPDPASGGELCLPATTFTWNQSSPAYWTENLAIGSSWGNSEWVRTGDFNGDGLTDIASIKGTSVYLKLAKPFGGFDSVTWTSDDIWPANSKDVMVGDFNGDGRTDFAFRVYGITPQSAVIAVKLARPVDSEFRTTSAAIGTNTWGPVERTFVAEVNGDGLADVVSFHNAVAGATTATAMVLLSKDPITHPSIGSGFGMTAETWTYSCPNISYSITCGAFGTDARDNHAGEISGDGVTDFIGVLNEGGSTQDRITYYQTDARQKTFYPSMSKINLDNADRRVRWLADFDGDGLGEIGFLDGSTTLRIVPASGNAYAKTLPAGISGSQMDWTWCFDFNGDGRADIVTRASGAVQVYQQSASGFAVPASPLGNITWDEYPYNVHLGDFNGDGLLDFASRTSSSSVSMLYSARQSGFTNGTNPAMNYDPGNAAQPDAIAQIRSGNGALIKLSYLSAAQGLSGGSTAPQDSTYDNLIVVAPIWTVHEVWSSHGVGEPTQMRGTRYQYFNLRADPRGRGIQGFMSETVKDLLTGDYEVTQYDTTWPRSGMILRRDRYLGSGERISSLVQTLEPATVPATPPTAPLFPYAKVSTETAYDDSGAAMIVSTTRQELPDSYGNFRKITTTTADPGNVVWSTKVTDSSYDNDTASWILGRLTRATVTHSAAGKTDKVKTASFTYYLAGDPSAGLLKTETVEPDKLNTSEWLETSYAYDSYGHKSKITVKGVGRDGSARSSRITSNSVSLSPGGSTLTTTTTAHLEDAVGASSNHVSTQVLSLAHGGVLSATDPNGRVTTSEYDPFGRKTGQSHLTASGSEIRADIRYEAADAYEAPNAVEKIITTDSAGGQSIVYQDLLGRTVRKKTLSLSGRWIHEDTDYDEQGRVITARRPAFDDELGAPINTRYDSRGRIDEIKSPGPEGTRLTTSYSYAGLTTTTTDPKGHYRVETRNALGQTVRVEDGSGSASVDYEYDALGNLERTTDAIGQVTVIGYDGQGRKTSMQDPHMGTWSYRYNSFGELEWQKDAKNQITLMAYDRLGRMISRQDHGDASPSTWTYDGPNGKGKLAAVQGQNQYLQTFQYNAESLPSVVSTTLRSTGAAKTFTATMTYDGQNRPWTTSHDSGFTLENVYERGYLVALRSPMENKLDVYDQSALQTRITEIMALLPTYQAQVTDLTLEVQNFTLAAAELNVEAAELEAALRNDPNQAANWEAIEDARTLADTYSGLAAFYQGYIDSAQADAERLRDYADFYIALESTPYTQTLHWQSLFSERATALNQEAAGLELQAAGYQSTVADFLSDANTQNTTADTLEAQILEEVTELQQQANAALAEAKAVRQEREGVLDQVARLESQLAMLQANTSDSDDITWWRADQVDAEGRITQELLGNGLFTRREYDPDTGHLLSIKTGGSNFSASGTNAADVQDVGYSYDEASNVVSRWDANVEILADYDYDSLDRLLSARISHPDTSLAPLNKTLAWEYDKAGNLQARTTNGARKKFTYVTDAVSTGTRQRLNWVQGVGDLVHDANGSLTQSGTRAFSFNTANQPITLGDGINSVSYQYGPDRNRLSKLETLNGKTWDTLYIHPGFERTRQTASNGSVVTEDRYALYAGNRLVGTRIKLTTDGVVTRRAEYYHEDALGSVEVITDSIGRLLRRYQYDPFGARTDITALSIYEAGLVRIVEDDPNTAINEKDVFNTLMVKGYTGHEHMDALGLIHMNGRVYDTRTSRFISADPIVQAPKDSQSYNRYSYVRNNPLKYTDPSGYSWLSKLGKKLKKWWRPLLAIAITAFAPYAGLGFWGTVMTGAAAGYVSSGGDWRAALIGGIAAGAFYGIGTHFEALAKSQAGHLTAGQMVQKVIAHGLVGGTSEVARGGKFGPGFLASGFSETFSATVGPSIRSATGQFVAATLVGGTAAELGGGKFANGAVTGAFGYAFNYALHEGVRANWEAKAQKVLSRIDEALNANPAAPVPLSPSDVHALMMSDAYGAGATGFDEKGLGALIESGDGLLWSPRYRGANFAIQGLPGIQDGVYSGSDINYYYQGFAGAIRGDSFGMVTTRIWAWNISHWDPGQISPGTAFARLGYDFYRNSQ